MPREQVAANEVSLPGDLFADVRRTGAPEGDLKGVRPSEEFTPATPVLEDYYFDLVNQKEMTVSKPDRKGGPRSSKCALG